ARRSPASRSASHQPRTVSGPCITARSSSAASMPPANSRGVQRGHAPAARHSLPLQKAEVLPMCPDRTVTYVPDCTEMKRQTLSAPGAELRDSHFSEGPAMLDCVEPCEASEHDDGAGFAVIPGPPSEAREDQAAKASVPLGCGFCPRGFR